jgi:catechol 2,3-dioxygenase-like lactoylglutathione lyase family enzyme
VEVLSGRVLLRPVDPARSHRFYGETLGLAVYREFGTPPDHGVVYFLGGGYLEVSGRSAAGAGAGALELWLQVRDVDAAHADLAGKGVEVLAPPEVMPWGLKEMWISDPDGVRIAVIEVPERHPLRYRP